MDFNKHILSDSMKLIHYDSINIKLSLNNCIILSVIDSKNDLIILSVIDSKNDRIILSVIDSMIDCIDLRLKINYSLNIKEGLNDSIKHSLNDIKDSNHKNICDISPQSTRAITLSSSKGSI